MDRTWYSKGSNWPGKWLKMETMSPRPKTDTGENTWFEIHLARYMGLRSILSHTVSFSSILTLRHVSDPHLRQVHCRRSTQVMHMVQHRHWARHVLRLTLGQTHGVRSALGQVCGPEHGSRITLGKVNGSRSILGPTFGSKSTLGQMHDSKSILGNTFHLKNAWF